MDALRITKEASEKAADEWGFNCGPGALCGLLDRENAERERIWFSPHCLQPEAELFAIE